MSSNWTIFQSLCQVISGQQCAALNAYPGDNLMPGVVEMAASRELLPALAFRCHEQPGLANALSDADNQCLRDALLKNTRRNMQIIAQATKLARTLNSSGIVPLFLKGTAQLLTAKEGPLGFRKQVDIDLVVKPAALLPAYQALLEAGYVHCQAALSINTPHHHLPPLQKDEYAATVELHRHFLPRRFQSKHLLEPLFASAIEHSSHGVNFLVPSTEYQIIHIVLGKLLHDGYLARREFPVREAMDYINLMENAQDNFDSELVVRQGGKAFRVFTGLVTELMGYTSEHAPPSSTNIKPRLGMMKMRHESPAKARLLDACARAEHLALSLLHNPAKLPAYLRLRWMPGAK